MKNREVSKEEAEKYFADMGLTYFEVSAKENINVDFIFQESLPKFYKFHKDQDFYVHPTTGVGLATKNLKTSNSCC